MTYGIEETPSGFEVEVAAEGREALFRDALAAALALACPAPGAPFERSVPVQAAGSDDATLLRRIVDEALRAAAEAPGALGPPRWLGFEPGRVTAMLPLAPGTFERRPLALRSAQVEPGRAALTLGGRNGA